MKMVRFCDQMLLRKKRWEMREGELERSVKWKGGADPNVIERIWLALFFYGGVDVEFASQKQNARWRGPLYCGFAFNEMDLGRCYSAKARQSSGGTE